MAHGAAKAGRIKAPKRHQNNHHLLGATEAGGHFVKNPETPGAVQWRVFICCRGHARGRRRGPTAQADHSDRHCLAVLPACKQDRAQQPSFATGKGTSGSGMVLSSKPDGCTYMSPSRGPAGAGMGSTFAATFASVRRTLCRRRRFRRVGAGRRQRRRWCSVRRSVRRSVPPYAPTKKPATRLLGLHESAVR